MPRIGPRRNLLLPIFALLSMAAGAFAQEPAAAQRNPHLWTPKTRSVAVFKNGYGFFMGDADVKLRDGWCTAADIPAGDFRHAGCLRAWRGPDRGRGRRGAG